jgi:hypothetical protein
MRSCYCCKLAACCSFIYQCLCGFCTVNRWSILPSQTWKVFFYVIFPWCLLIMFRSPVQRSSKGLVNLGETESGRRYVRDHHCSPTLLTIPRWPSRTVRFYVHQQNATEVHLSVNVISIAQCLSVPPFLLSLGLYQIPRLHP